MSGVLAQIIHDTTTVHRKGAVIEERDLPGVHVTEIFGYPPATDIMGNRRAIDCHFIIVGVDMATAEENRAAFVAALADYPQPDRLALGPSYIEIGAELGSQEAAFRMMALGAALGMWDVITPATLGITGPDADPMAGSGFVMISGYTHTSAEEVQS